MDDFEKIESLLELKYQHSQQTASSFILKENKLRTELAKLDDHKKKADRHSVSVIQTLGADVLWKAWVEKARAALNMELAQVLAQKENAIQSVRKDFAKLNVCRQLSQDHLAKAKSKTARQKLNAAIEAELFSRH